MTFKLYKSGKFMNSLVFTFLAAISLGLATPALAAATATAPNALSTSEIPPSALLGWAQYAVFTTFNYDYKNYKASEQNAAAYFTPEAWKQYSKALDSSGNLKAIIDRKMRVIAIPGQAKILDQGVANGHYSWKISLPLKMIFQNAQDNSVLQEQNSMVTLVVGKTPQGIAIGSLFMEQKKS